MRTPFFQATISAYGADDHAQLSKSCSTKRMYNPAEWYVIFPVSVHSLQTAILISRFWGQWQSAWKASIVLEVAVFYSYTGVAPPFGLKFLIYREPESSTHFHALSDELRRNKWLGNKAKLTINSDRSSHVFWTCTLRKFYVLLRATTISKRKFLI